MKYRININEVPMREFAGRELWSLVGGDEVRAEEMSLSVVDVLPGAVTKPGHVHRDAEEIIFVTSGEGQILIGDETNPLTPGDAIIIPRGVPHLIRNIGREKMRLICSFSTPDVSRGIESLPELDFTGIA
jgi:quercetin dioxygenase-like cupin family protein